MNQNGPRLRVKNWTKFQHYKNRNPTWIKLHCELLDDYEFLQLSDASKLLAICTMLIAARSENHIPNDPEWITNRLSLRTPADLQTLISAGFLETCDCKHCASNTLAGCKQSASLETETYTKETETEVHPPNPPKGGNRRSRKALADSPAFSEFWNLYPRRVGKGAARKAWARRMNPSEDAVLAACQAALSWQVRSEPWTKDGGAFIPHPATYLNQERWSDEPPPRVSSPGQPATMRPNRKLTEAEKAERGA